MGKLIAPQREILRADRTYSIAIADLQATLDALAANVDFGGKVVTIQLADGTLTTAVIPRRMVGIQGPAGLIIQGNAATPGNTKVSVTGGTCFLCNTGVFATFKDLKLETTTSGNCITAQVGSAIDVNNVDFGACAADHIYSAMGARVRASGNYGISGAAVRHWEVGSGGAIEVVGRTVTITNTPAFSAAFAVASAAGAISCSGNTFTGSATGTRYVANLNGVIVSGGATLPGNGAGSTATGGQVT